MRNPNQPRVRIGRLELHGSWIPLTDWDAGYNADASGRYVWLFLRWLRLCLIVRPGKLSACARQ